MELYSKTFPVKIKLIEEQKNAKSTRDCLQIRVQTAESGIPVTGLHFLGSGSSGRIREASMRPIHEACWQLAGDWRAEIGVSLRVKHLLLTQADREKCHPVSLA